MRSGRHKTRSAEEARLRSVCPFSLRELRAGPAERQKTGRPEASQQNEAFVALVDSSIAADTGSDSANSTQQPFTSQRRAKNAGSADDRPSRPDPASPTAKSASDDRDSGARET